MSYNYYAPPPNPFIQVSDGRVYPGYVTPTGIIKFRTDFGDRPLITEIGPPKKEYIYDPITKQTLMLTPAPPHLIPNMRRYFESKIFPGIAPPGSASAAVPITSLVPYFPRGQVEQEDVVMGTKTIQEYILISHGETTNSPIDTRYRMKTDLESVSFYTPHLFFLSTMHYNSLKAVSHFAKARHEVINSRDGEIILPPVIFSGEYQEPYTFKDIIGLYRYRSGERIRPEDMVEINDPSIGYNGLFNNDYLISGSLVKKTYSRIAIAIEQDIQKVAAEAGITGTKEQIASNYSVRLRLFCCRGPLGYPAIEQLIHNATYNITGMTIPYGSTGHFSLGGDPAKYRRYSGAPSNLMLFRFEPITEAKIESLNSLWLSAGGGLLNILYQGCGLNVLAFLRYLPRMDLLSRVATLYKCGTSIHNFIDYISYTPTRNQVLGQVGNPDYTGFWQNMTSGIPITEATEFIPIRFTIADALSYLNECRVTMPSIFINMTIPIKLYRDADSAIKGIGHFVLIFLPDNATSPARIYDPQTNFYNYITSHNDFTPDKINDPNRKVDFIFRSGTATPNQLLMRYTSEDNAATGEKKAIEVPRRPDLKWGGGRGRGRGSFRGGREVRSQLMQDVLTSVPEVSKSVNSKLPRASYKEKESQKVMSQLKESVKESMEERADKIRDMLIYNLTAALYCEDEFINMIPEDELENFKPPSDETRMPKKQISNSRIRMSASQSRSKSHSRSRSRSRAGSKKKTRKARRKTARRKLRTRSR